MVHQLFDSTPSERSEGETAMNMDDMIIVSVDDHAIEPPTAFLSHYPVAFRDDALAG